LPFCTKYILILTYIVYIGRYFLSPLFFEVPCVCVFAPSNRQKEKSPMYTQRLSPVFRVLLQFFTFFFCFAFATPEIFLFVDYSERTHTHTGPQKIGGTKNSAQYTLCTWVLRYTLYRRAKNGVTFFSVFFFSRMDKKLNGLSIKGATRVYYIVSCFFLIFV
jgi:hypothetical protein